MRNYVLYMQNVDDWHTREHYKPFLSSTGRRVDGQIETKKFDDRFFLYAAYWEKGHAGPPQEFLKSLLRGFRAEEVDFNSALFSVQMNKMLSAAEVAK